MLHLLIIEGNTADIRARHREAGGEIAHSLYARALRQTGVDFTHDVIFPADADAALPPGSMLAGYDGIVWTGSALNVYTGGFAVTRQLDLARACFASGVPQFGSCWGLQVAVAAAGGAVIANPKGREIGIAHDIRLTPAGRAHAMYRGKADRFDALAVHKDTISTLPPGAAILASNANSDVQATAFIHEGGEFWGVQYHPEYHFGEVAACMRRYGDSLVTEGLFPSRDAVLETAEAFARLDGPAEAELLRRFGIDRSLTVPAERLRDLTNWFAFLAAGKQPGRALVR